MREFGSKCEADMLRDAKTMDLADVIIYVHDSSDTNSFSYVSNLRVGNMVAEPFWLRI
jgi:Ras family protein T1